MTMEDLIGGLPAYAKDMKLNYSSLVKQNTELTAAAAMGHGGGLRDSDEECRVDRGSDRRSRGCGVDAAGFGCGQGRYRDHGNE